MKLLIGMTFDTLDLTKLRYLYQLRKKLISSNEKKLSLKKDTWSKNGIHFGAFVTESLG